MLVAVTGKLISILGVILAFRETWLLEEMSEYRGESKTSLKVRACCT